MTVFRKTMPNGRKTPHYHYRVMVDGKIYTGSTGCSRKAEAEQFERDHVQDLRRDFSEREVLLKLHERVSGGRNVALCNAWERFLRMPRASMCNARKRATKSRWCDFLAYMSDNHPNATMMRDVTASMARGYIAHVRTHGRWQPRVHYRRSGRRRVIEYDQELRRLSNSTKNDILQTCRMIFRHLLQEAGCTDNPFDGIDALPRNSETREAFTPEELRIIGERAEEPLYSFFLAGISTGFREGDICTLKWDEVDMVGEEITRRMLKTRKTVRLPILSALHRHLSRLSREGDYVFPDLAEMYLENPSGISYRVNKLLRDVGISTQRTIPERDRAVSVKDAHSLRHTFVYLAGLNGVPLPIVQSVVGHLDEAMTRHYMDHATAEDRRRELARIPDYLSVTQEQDDPADAIRREMSERFADTDRTVIEAAVAALQEMLGRQENRPVNLVLERIPAYCRAGEAA